MKNCPRCELKCDEHVSNASFDYTLKYGTYKIKPGITKFKKFLHWLLYEDDMGIYIFDYIDIETSVNCNRCGKTVSVNERVENCDYFSYPNSEQRKRGKLKVIDLWNKES